MVLLYKVLPAILFITRITPNQTQWYFHNSGMHSLTEMVIVVSIIITPKESRMVRALFF